MKLLFRQSQAILDTRFCFLEGEPSEEISPLRSLLNKLDAQGDKWSDIREKIIDERVHDILRKDGGVGKKCTECKENRFDDMRQELVSLGGVELAQETVRKKCQAVCQKCCDDAEEEAQGITE